ncbi:MAG: hypothetical protein JXC32_13040 [Anaerolineae bacterium]|nr:hypothetical protein [Anaerolineae bacterium]
MGPERPTLVERVLALLPLPYGWAAVLVAALLGPPGSLLIGFLETGDLEASMSAFFYGHLPERRWQEILSIILWFAFYTILFWTIAYARRSVIKSRKALTPRLSEPGAFDAAFGHVSWLLPALLIGFAIEALFIGDYRARLASAPGPVSTVYEAVSGPPLYLMSGTAIWVYASAVWGLFRLGKGSLRLKPFYEDESMGLKPMAKLSLSLSAAYFGLLLIMGLMLLIGPVRTEYVITVATLLVLGLVLFFLPLIGAHRRMKAEKKALREAVRARWEEILAGTLTPTEDEEDEPRTFDPGAVLALEALERKVAAAQTWPVDVPILSKLGVMALSIILALVTQIVSNLLGL